ncbi:MAG: threonine synthase [Calditrichaeota bacterium]|nr:MAG: threonine synthase [Calditrichota bacterium]
MTHLECTLCGSHYSAEVLYTCPRCGIEGILDVHYDYERITAHFSPATLKTRSRNHWRYRELLPISGTAMLPSLELGWSPVYAAKRLARWAGVRELWLKDDGRNPTASLKDRASAVGVVKCREFGFETIACASTGNAASSLAGMSAAMGLPAYIFIPERAPEPKVAQLLIFGARVLKVRGTYDQAYDLCMQACEHYGWYNRNCAINPYLVEGKKTCGLEIGEQMADRISDWVAVSVGDGCTIAGIWKGLKEMHLFGFIPRLPRLLGVQAEGAQPVVQAFQTGEDLVPGEVHTLADSIAVGTPRNWRKAVRAVRESGGTMLTVTDDEILEAMRAAARLGGVFGEPAGVTGLAGIRRAVQRGIISHEETTLTVITGNGLKDVQSARQAAGAPDVIEPEMGALERLLKAHT